MDRRLMARCRTWALLLAASSVHLVWATPKGGEACGDEVCPAPSFGDEGRLPSPFAPNRGVLLMQMSWGGHRAGLNRPQMHIRPHPEKARLKLAAVQEDEYAAIQNVHGLCLDASMPTIPSTSLTMRSCVGESEHQEFLFNKSTGLVSNAYLMCLDAGASASDGGAVMLTACTTPTPTIMWTYDESTHQLKSHSGKCLYTPAPTSNGGAVQTTLCDSTPNQQWKVGVEVPRLVNYGMILDQNGGCLDAPTSDLVHIWRCIDREPNQLWTYDASTRQIKQAFGSCLEASGISQQGAFVHVMPCSTNPVQLWAIDQTTGQLKNDAGLCLQASAPGQKGSDVRMWKCDPRAAQGWHFSNQDAFYTFLPVDNGTDRSCVGSGGSSDSASYVLVTAATLDACQDRCVLKDVCHGISFQDSANRCEIWTADIVSSVPLAGSTCQRISRGTVSSTTTLPVPITIETTTEETTTETTTAPPTTTAAQAGTSTEIPGPTTTTTVTASTTAGPLQAAVRNCFLAPLVEGAACQRVETFESSTDFGLNEFGQETTAKKACLEKLREQGGDTFVFTVGRCEIWNCGSTGALRLSAGPGGMAAIKGGGQLKSSYGGFVGVETNGNLNVVTKSWQPGSIFIMDHRRPGVVALRSYLNNLYVTCKPSGDLFASSQTEDTWEEYNVTDLGGGKVALMSFHGKYLSAKLNGVIYADATQQDASTVFELVDFSTLPAAPAQTDPSAPGTQVFSELCKYQEGYGGLHGAEPRSPVVVKLMEWNHNDVARECVEYLAPNGVDFVQISPATEHVMGDQWWTKYQPTSAGHDSRSGSAAELQAMVATCRAAGVQVILDILLNHMASPCDKATSKSTNMPCTGWNGSQFGYRRAAGRYGWDAADQDMFHHKPKDPTVGLCNVGPHTGWLCPNNDCTYCDMYGMPDFNTEIESVRDRQAKILESFYEIGITGLRIDAAIYHHVPDLASMLNRFAWDIVFQEWWGEYPVPDRTKYVGLYRDVAYRWKLVNVLANEPVEAFSDLLQLNQGVFGITPDIAIYPFLYHDGRSNDVDSTIATYKNGLEYHQQQKFFLSWIYGSTVVLWGGYGWANTEQGPPGCEPTTVTKEGKCFPTPVYAPGSPAGTLPNCLLEAPTVSPMPAAVRNKRQWICEHRWAGVAGMINFRKACRTLPVAETWAGGNTSGVALGNVAFRLQAPDDSSETPACFVALVRGYNEVSKPVWGHLGDWKLNLTTGLPPGRYCDLASLSTQAGWDKKTCPREVVLGKGGVVISGTVPEGDILAIHTGAKLT